MIKRELAPIATKPVSLTIPTILKAKTGIIKSILMAIIVKVALLCV
jgi:hypothetical protein